MKKIFITFFLILTVILDSWAQDVMLWEKNYGGTHQSECIFSIEDYKGNGYLLSGATESEDYDFSNNKGGLDAFLIRTDLNGNLIWAKNYGSNADDMFMFSKMDHEGNIYAVGTSGESNGDVDDNKGENDVWIVKTDSLGTILWEKSYGGSLTECAYEFVFTQDSTLMVVCVTESTNGDVAGSGYNGGSSDIWILHIDPSDGNIIWKKCYGGTEEDGYPIYIITNLPHKNVSIATHGDGFYTITGASRSLGNGGYDVMVISIDSLGTVQNLLTYGGFFTEVPKKIKPTPDGGFVICANTQSSDGDISTSHGSNDGWLLKLDASLNLEWERAIGGSLYDDCSDVLVVENGYYVVGRAESSNGDCLANYGDYDVALFFVYLGGDVWWAKNFGTTEDNFGVAIFETPDNNVVVGGSSRGVNYDVTNNYGFHDLWLFEYSDVSSTNSEELLPISIIPFPNPAQNYLCFSEKLQDYTLTVYDATGRIVMNQVFFENCITVNTLVSGIYFFHLSDESRAVYSGKFVKE